MNKIKNITLFFLILFSFSSCNNTPEEIEKSVVGTWVLLNYSFTSEEAGIKSETEVITEVAGWEITLNADGTIVCGKGQWEELIGSPSSYVYDSLNKKLIISLYAGDGEFYGTTVLIDFPSQEHMTWTLKFEEGNYSNTMVFSFQKKSI